MTHTLGPWKAQRKSKDSMLHVTAGHFQVFLGTHVGAPMREWEANAHLIAAAPELLEALELCLKRLNYHLSDVEDCDLTNPDEMAFKKAREAIARATGQ